MKKNIYQLCLLALLIFVSLKSSAQIPQLWGMTSHLGVPGISADGNGTIFSINGDGTGYNQKYVFKMENPGFIPGYMKLLEASNGKLYGTTSQGGPYNNGGGLFVYDFNTNTYTRKHIFGGSNNSREPWGSLVNVGGILYGVSKSGGVNSSGAIYSYNPATDVFTDLYSFNNAIGDGSSPCGRLLAIDTTRLYGMTFAGGNGLGVIFEYNRLTGVYTKKINLNGTTGYNPIGTLIKANNGKLYGMTKSGGSLALGTLFEYDYNNNTLIVKVDFDGTKGKYPNGDLLQAPNGKLYGMTQNGGDFDTGVLFEYDYSSNTFIKKQNMDGYPSANLMIAGNGKMYGLTRNSLFEYDYINNILTQKKFFSSSDGYNSDAMGTLMEASNGKIYGMNNLGGNSKDGILFEYNYTTNAFTKKIDLNASPEGCNPLQSLIKAPNGKFYSTTHSGGNLNDPKKYVLFEFDPITNTYQKKIERGPGVDPEDPGDLILAANGKFYGLSYIGGQNGQGELYEYDFSSNTFTRKISFNASIGLYPVGFLLQAPNGKLYGLTQGGGVNNQGTLFEYDYATNNLLKKIDFIDSVSGNSPVGDLMLAQNGKMYGLANGGTNQLGVIYEYNYITNTITKKYDLNTTNGNTPSGQLVEGINGSLYGTTTYGGASNKGVFFEFNYITNVFTNRFDFNSITGGSTKSLLMKASDGKIYGMSGSSQSSIFSTGIIYWFDPQLNLYQKFFDFTYPNSGNPYNTRLLEVTASNTIATNQVPAVLCKGSGVNVSYTVTGTFNPGNIFTAQLSSSTGSFSSPVNIGTLSSTASGIISANIPSPALSDTGYRIRVISSNPVITGLDNGTNFTISSIPIVPVINGLTGFCRPSTGNIYTATPVQAGLNYNWTLPTGATINNGQGTSTITVSFASNAVSGNICITASSSCGSSPTVCKAITLRTTLPSTPGTITGSNNGCAGESKLYTIRKISNADSYLWTPPIGTTINGFSAVFSTVDTFVTVTFTPTFTGDTLRVKSVNCMGTGTTERKLRINKNAPSTPGTITGTTTGLCNLSGKLYSINAVTNALTYTWRTNIVGATINGSTSPVTTSNSVTVNFGTFVSGQLYVKANNNCGSSTERALTVYARPVVPASITGPITVCDGDTGVVFSTAAVTNATAYNWTTLSGSTITTGQNSTAIKIHFGFVATSGLVRVRSQNSCASSSYLSKTVTVNICPRLMQESTKNDLYIQPNPFSDFTTLMIPFENDLASSQIVIYNVLGKEVRRMRPEDDVVQIEKGDLTPGLYILKLICNECASGSLKMIIN